MKLSNTLAILGLVIPTATAAPWGPQQLIKRRDTGKCLSDEGYDHMIPRECNFADPKQLFQKTLDWPVHNAYMIRNLHTNNCLDGNSAIRGLFTYACKTNEAAHHWKLVDNGKIQEQSGSKNCVCEERSGNHQFITCPCADTTARFDFLDLTSAPTDAPTTKNPTIAPTKAPVTEPPTDPPLTTVTAADPVMAADDPLPARFGSSSGDPHFTTFNDQKYDFHGGCDLVLLANPNFANGLGLYIHIRTKIETWWSYIQSAVVHIGGQSFELQGGPIGEGPKYWINGLVGDSDVSHDNNLEDMVTELQSTVSPCFNIHYTPMSTKQHRFRVDLTCRGDAMSVQTYKDWVSVNVKAKNATSFEGSKGLMGRYPDGAMVGRDGETVIQNTDSFGQEWQVLNSEPMLFQTVSGPQHPTKCLSPTEAAASRKERRLGASKVTREDAEMACAQVGKGDLDACIYDVLVTQDKDTVGAY